MSDEQRTTPTLEAPDKIRASLQNWLQQHVYNDKAIEITSFDIPEGTGMSNITVLFDVSINDSIIPMVARIQAQGEKLAFPAYDLPMQADIMQRLAYCQGINVPPIIAMESTGDVVGVPFYIMKKIDGLIPPDIPPYHMDGWIVESSPAEREHMWYACIDMMSKLHILPLNEEPLRSFIRKHDFPKSLDEQLKYWESYMDWGLEGADNPHCTKALQWLRDNQPEDNNRYFCWGDSRMANVIITEDKTDVAALLDWEMLALGDPCQDIAWWIFMDELFSLGLGVPRLEGFPDRLQTLSHWKSNTGCSDEHFHYYMVFAGLRISLILARMSLAKGDNGMLHESFASIYMDNILEEGNA